MQKLYLDCDGVILDTINKSYRMLKEEGLTTEEEVAKFYNDINWTELIEESGQINNAISEIKELRNYFDIEILTHVYSNNEIEAKLKYFASELPNINVVTVPKNVKKADFVDARDAILVDDYILNLDYWASKGGIAIKFSDSGKVCKYNVISNLLELIDIFNKDKVNE